jgi:hypothetical protein
VEFSDGWGLGLTLLWRLACETTCSIVDRMMLAHGLTRMLAFGSGNADWQSWICHHSGISRCIRHAAGMF